ncbi:hypothetical protein BC938DRAFT_475251 [Jimgerdemannia flammicorona]|uniref:Uncharacterized protein n=1 Tax=Jimgerdemannia flammicorona TaxID=994334 RepID=A0A433QRU1_9FUNG|nr:hypothetical protein BC938DRAFT_475251 [Jimgerdemannia flammicorona]
MSLYTQPQSNANPSDDAAVQVQSPPTDGISSLSFSPQADFLAASSWDNQACTHSAKPLVGGCPFTRNVFSRAASGESVAHLIRVTKIPLAFSNVRMWEVQQNGSTVPKAAYSHEGPALCCQWSKAWHVTLGVKLANRRQNQFTSNAGRLL